MEADHCSTTRAIKQGCWHKVAAVEPSTADYGPRQPTIAERQAVMDESTALSDLGAGFKPDPADVAWITCYLSQSSVEGPRESNLCFWSRDALCDLFHQHGPILGHGQEGLGESFATQRNVGSNLRT